MNSQVCVNCRNEKPVNSTDNRLVTESCGHVKCMDCLLREKSGCIACLDKLNTKIEVEVSLDETLNEEVADEEDQCDQKNDDEKSNDGDVDKEIQCELFYDLPLKKKPETSHIKIESDSSGKHYLCTVCKKKFTSRSQVVYHAYCNGQKKPFQCPECTKSFATLSHYKYHMRVHRNERTYSCDVCSEAFFQMSKLQRHMLTHTKEKKYSCNQCNKAFNNLTALRKHHLTHTEERPYTCGTCSSRFRDISNFRKHVLKHGNGQRQRPERKPHQCPRCPQAFHSMKDMRRHSAVHSDSKPFRCKVCNRSFRRKDNLERHIRNTHPNYVPSAAVECDEAALKKIRANGQSTKLDYQDEKTKLEILNPLPPLPPEVIQKHIEENPAEKNLDKSYILVANNARQSVIVGKKTANIVKVATPTEECEYVHKIRKASIIPLPPIDLRKIMELEERTNLNNLNSGGPPKSKKMLYEKILYGDSEKQESEDTAVDSGASIHWRRKMKQSVSIDLK